MENSEVNKLNMKSANIIGGNIEKIQELFPNVVKEGKIDFNALKQELSDKLLEEKKEKYQLTWAGKNNAILEANRYLNSSNANSQKLILVIGSGYSDSGVLDFAHGGIIDKYIANKSNIEVALREDERIRGGELSGTAVYWYNMSYVASPQPSMEDYRNATTDIYEAALRYAGVTNMRLNLKVKRAQASIDTIHTVDPVYVEPLKPGDYLSIDDTVSRFLNNQTILQNPEYVKSYISTFVQKLKDTSYSLLVTGYMDHCLPDNRALSKGRAEVIKGLLIEMGISGDKIEAYGEYGPPPKDPNAPYVCQDDENVPDEEQRTVRIVVKQWAS